MTSNTGDLTTDIGTIYRRLGEMIDGGEAGVLATVICTRQSTPRHAGSKMIIHADGSVTGSVGGGRAEAEVVARARDVLADNQCRTLELDLVEKLGVCGGQMEVFLEPVLQTTPFVVVGAGHIGRAMVQLGRDLAFRFTIIDDRPEWLSPLSGSSGVQTLSHRPEDLAGHLRVSGETAVLIASRNHELDGAYLRAFLEAEQEQDQRYGFLGVLGSRRKVAHLREALLEQDWPMDRLDALQMPVGLDLGAETPAEIALSILAEVLAVLRGRGTVTDVSGQPVGIRLHRTRSGGQGAEESSP